MSMYEGKVWRVDYALNGQPFRSMVVLANDLQAAIKMMHAESPEAKVLGVYTLPNVEAAIYPESGVVKSD